MTPITVGSATSLAHIMESQTSTARLCQEVTSVMPLARKISLLDIRDFSCRASTEIEIMFERSMNGYRLGVLRARMRSATYPAGDPAASAVLTA